MSNSTKHVKTIGILFETVENAKEISIDHLELLHHWREPDELEIIKNSIEKLGFDTVLLGTPNHFINNLSKFQNKIDFIFTLSVGFITRYRQLLGASACELLGIPYTGADPYAKLVGQNKHLTKLLLNKLNIPTPEWAFISSMKMLKETQIPSFPVIVKPVCEGTSVGINKSSLVTTYKRLKEQIEYVIDEVKLPVIVEQFIVGKEFKVGFIGNHKRLFEGMFEDVHPDGSSLEYDFLYYDNKKNNSFVKLKRDFFKPQYKQLRKDCDRIYRLFCPLDYGIFDIRQDKKGKFYFIEINTDATLHPERSLAQCCELNNVIFDEMIKKILECSFKRQGIHWN